MSKIGTAHVEIKPVLNKEALAQMIDELMVAIEQAVALNDALDRGLRSGGRRPNSTTWPPLTTTDRTAGCPCRTENGGSGICGCILSGPVVSYGSTANTTLPTSPDNPHA